MIEERLKGASLAQRHKCLNEMVMNATSEEFTPQIISNLLKEKSQLDQIYLVRVADKLKKSAVICELLKSEDGLIVNKALKCTWFFNKKLNGDFVNADYFIENIIPFVSYSTKSKIITNLSIHLNDYDTAEIIYKAMMQIHGRKFAIKLLTACSETFIWENLIFPDDDISELQMKYLFKKYPQLIIRYVKRCLDSKNNCDNYLIIMIFQDHPDVFMELYEEYYKYIHVFFTYRMTYYLLKNKPDFVLTLMPDIFPRLNFDAALKLLKGDLRDQFIVKLFPGDSKEYPYDVMPFIEKMKSEHAVLYFIKIYERVYGKPGLLNTNLKEGLVEHLPIEMRKVWAENMIAIKSDEAKFLKYLSVDIAIERYKVLNRSASTVYERTSILENMIDCCKINNDTKALLDVLKYVVQRHKNDIEELRYNFLSRLQNKFKLHQLSEEHWDVIDEFLTIMYLNKEVETNYRYHFLSGILEEKIHYNLINNVEIGSVIDKMIEYNLNKFNMLTHISEYEEKILNVVFEKYKIKILDQEMNTKVEAMIVMLLNTYKDWNANHSEKPKSVTDCDWMMIVIRKWFAFFDTQHKNNSCVVRLLWNDIKARKIFLNDLAQFYCNDKVIKNLLIHNFDIILNNISLFLKNSTCSYTVDSYRYIFYKIRAYIDKPLGDKIRQKLLEDIENPGDSSPETIGAMIVALSFLSNAEDIEGILKKYMADVTKIKIDKSITDIDKKEYQKTSTVLEKLKFVNPPISFDTMQKYAKEDYLKFALPSMLSMCFKKNPKQTNDFLIRISRKNIPVSIKKHSVRLFYFLSPIDKLTAVYTELWNGEKNSSMRDVIFQRSFKVMTVQNQNPAIVMDMWQSIKHFFTSFTEEDKNLFSYFSSLQKIDKSFYSEYCQISWTILKRLAAEKKCNVDKPMTTFVDVINVELLDEKFCESIVQEYLLSVDYTKDNESTLSHSLLRFCVSYLTKVKDANSQTKRVDEICKIFKNYITLYWDRLDDNYSSRKSVHTFVTNYCYQILVEKSVVSPLSALSSLDDMLTATMPYEALFELHLFIKITILLIKSKEETDVKDFTSIDTPSLLIFFKSFSGLLVDYFKTLSSTYGLDVFCLYNPILNDLLMYIFSNCLVDNTSLNLYFLKELFNVDSKSRETLRLIVELLPLYPQTLNATQSITFTEIIEMLVSCNDVVIKMALNKKIGIPSDVFKKHD